LIIHFENARVGGSIPPLVAGISITHPASFQQFIEEWKTYLNTAPVSSPSLKTQCFVLNRR
jgi:hypothetical protein